jgi:hypothetical protein
MIAAVAHNGAGAIRGVFQGLDVAVPERIVARAYCSPASELAPLRFRGTITPRSPCATR